MIGNSRFSAWPVDIAVGTRNVVPSRLADFCDFRPAFPPVFKSVAARNRVLARRAASPFMAPTNRGQSAMTAGRPTSRRLCKNRLVPGVPRFFAQNPARPPLSALGSILGGSPNRAEKISLPFGGGAGAVNSNSQ